jgi:hypothetical protein
MAVDVSPEWTCPTVGQPSSGNPGALNLQEAVRMKRKRHTAERIIGMPRKAEVWV